MLRKTIFVLGFLAPAIVFAQGFKREAFWSSQNGQIEEAVVLGVPEAEFQRAFDYYVGNDLELSLIDAYDLKGDVFFNMAFRTRTSSSWLAKAGMRGLDFELELAENRAAGRCLRHLDVYRTGADQLRYAAVFKTKACAQQEVYHGLSASEHQLRFDALTAKGWAPVNVSVVSVGGDRIYAAFYEQQQGDFSVQSFLTTDAISEHAANLGPGYEITYMDGYTHDLGQLPRYSAIWRKRAKPVLSEFNIGGQQVGEVSAKLNQSGHHVRYITGFSMGGPSHRFNIGAYDPNMEN